MPGGFRRAFFIAMNVSITVIPHARRIQRRFLAAACRWFAGRSAQRIHTIVPWQRIDLIFTDDVSMAEINRAVVNHEGPTDVITQKYDPLPGEPEGLCGEIYINLDETLRHPDPEREILLYLAHGCDHLSGADDASSAERRTMRRRELGWIRTFLAETAIKR